MTIFGIILLFLAGFNAGVINAIAGGGSFLTFPALVFTGAKLARRMSANVVRAIVVVIGIVMTVVFAMRG